MNGALVIGAIYALALLMFWSGTEYGYINAEAHYNAFVPVVITVYNAAEGQTDHRPLETADGSIIDPINPQHWVAVSRDLLDEIPMGSTVEISCRCPYNGQVRVVHDKMGARAVQSIDVLGLAKGGYFPGSIKLIK